MHSAPTVRVHVNNNLTQQIRLLKGTKQGCPLSPILFNMAQEPLSRHLLDNPGLHGIKIGQIEVKSALFADDILLYSS